MTTRASPWRPTDIPCDVCGEPVQRRTVDLYVVQSSHPFDTFVQLRCADEDCDGCYRGPMPFPSFHR
jgi:hypothetical protein